MINGMRINRVWLDEADRIDMAAWPPLGDVRQRLDEMLDQLEADDIEVGQIVLRRIDYECLAMACLADALAFGTAVFHPETYRAHRLQLAAAGEESLIVTVSADGTFKSRRLAEQAKNG